MKFRHLIILVLLIVFLSFTVQARKGVGLVWDTQTAIVYENSEHCVRYGIYNPWEDDVNAILSVSDELKDVIINEDSEEKLITAGTFHEYAVPMEFCFKIAKTYEEDCWIPGLFCKQECNIDPVQHEGKVIAMEAPSEGGSGSIAGSATSLGVSVPLKLKVKCKEHAREMTPLYILIIVIVLIIIGTILWKRKNK